MIIEIPAYASGDQALWTPKLVKAALVQAHQVYRDTVGRVGPNRMRAIWPDFYREWDDWIDQAATSGTDAAKKRRGWSSFEIARADMVLLGWRDEAGKHQPAWLNGPLLDYERPRKALMAWVMCKHHGVTEVELCRRANWPRATFLRHKDFAAGRIAHRLNGLRLRVW